MRFGTRALFPGRDRQESISINLELNQYLRCARDHRWNAPQLKLRQRTTVLNQLTLTLEDMNQHGRLTVSVGRKLLLSGCRDRCIPGNDFLRKPPHGFQPQ